MAPGKSLIITYGADSKAVAKELDDIEKRHADTAAKISGVGTGVKDSLGKAESATGGVKSALGGLVGVAAGVGAISMFKGMISEAQESAKTTAQTEAAIKSTGGAAQVTTGHIGKLANAISLKTGIDDEQIQAGQNMLLTFTGIRNVTNEQAAAIEKSRLATAGHVVDQKAMAAATKAVEQADTAEAKASENLSNLKERLSGKTKLSISEQQQLEAATARVAETTDKATKAHAAYDSEAAKATAATGLLKEGVKGSNDIFDQATKLALDMSVALGQDMTQSAMQLGKALNDPISGVTALQRVGVRLTEQQKEQVKAFVASGDTLSAQKIILNELSTEFGGSAAAQATAADKAKVAWKNFQENLGTAVMPMLNTLLGGLTNVLQTFMALPGPVQAGIAALAGILVLAGPLSSVVGTLGSLGGAALKLGPMFVSAAWSISGAMASTLPAIGAFLVAAGPIILIVAAIGVAAYLLYRNWDTVWTFIKDISAAAFNWIRDHLVYIALAFGPLGLIIYEFGRHWRGVMEGIQAVISWVWDTISPIIHFIGEAIRLYIVTEITILKAVWDVVWAGVVAVAGAAWDVLKPIIGGIGNTLGWLVDHGIALVKAEIMVLFAVWSVVWNGIQAIVQGVWKVIEPIIHAIGTGLRDIGGAIKSVASVGGAVGHFLGFQAGGTVPGPVGAPMLAVVHGGEEITPVGGGRGRGGGGDIYVNVVVSGSVTSERNLTSTIYEGLLEVKRRQGSLGLA